MIRKYVSDAENILAAQRNRSLLIRQQRQAVLRRNHILKMCLLGTALAGVACGLYYAHDLGGLLATNVSQTQFNAPVIEVSPPSKARTQRKLSESRRQREEDLAEIEKF